MQQGDEIVILCIAGKPRFPARDERPFPPNRVVVFHGQNMQIRTCGINVRRNDLIRCNGTLRITSTTMATVGCVAVSDSGCRLITLNLPIRKRNTRK